MPEPGSQLYAFWYGFTISATLVLAGGVFAGLTLGLMGLDELHLRVLAASSPNSAEKANAEKVLKLVSKGRHWILVISETRLQICCDQVINESLPIFLDDLVSYGQEVLLNARIVIFGVRIIVIAIQDMFKLPSQNRIIPQAVCVRYGLAIGAKCAPFISTLMWMLAPVAYPIARILDWALRGKAHNTYKKEELKSLLQFHCTGEEPLCDNEIAIINGVLELNTRKVESVMIPMTGIVTLSSDCILDQARVDLISSLLSGQTHFPVYASNDPVGFIGLLSVKDKETNVQAIVSQKPADEAVYEYNQRKKSAKRMAASAIRKKCAIISVIQLLSTDCAL
ncbi:Protein MAM3 [Termitomyces sp. J132]|nr:Protein MAM3 [Termitomyces sp. J132]